MEGLTHIRIPTLRCSFPLFELHPLYERLVEEIDAFCRRSAKSTADERALDFIVAEKYPFLACAFWPTALDARLPWVTKFLCWFIFLDTEVDDINSLANDGKSTALLMHKYIAVISQGQGKGEGGDVAPVDDDQLRTDDMFLSCFASLWEHFRCNMSRTQYTWLSSRCFTLFTLIAHQSKLREEGAVVSPTELLELKRVISSGTILAPLMQYALGTDLDERMLNQPKIQEMEVACIDHMVITNDILSFRKEYLGRDFHNLPSSFCFSKGVDIGTAVELASELAHDADRRFCELHAVASNASYCTPQVKLFIDGLGYMMSGALEWCWHTARYHGRHWVAPPPEARQGIMYLEDQDPARFEPVYETTAS